MGVPGLWDLIRPAAARTSLAELGRTGFLANKNGQRAFTIGIDASIWIFHAQQTTKGANAYQRTLFYKLCALLQHPILVVFVFDGANKPNMKRGQRVAGRFGVNDLHSRKFKDLLDACGVEWWNAPGEAEAELALMNKQGKIDAVLSDDVDALVFGATCLIRNNSPTLSGAQASSTHANSTKSELRHWEMYRIGDICATWASEESELKTIEDCRMAMVLIAILSGGDYAPEGASRMGPAKAMGLARAGHAHFLRSYANARPDFPERLEEVHKSMVAELETNSRGFVGRKYKVDAARLAALRPEEVFPSLPLDSYLCPSTSPKDDPTQGWPGFGRGERTAVRGKSKNCGSLDLEGMARACEMFFEWGTKELVCKKFATDSVHLYGAEIIEQARRYSPPTTKDTATRPMVAEGARQKSPPSALLTSYFPQAVTKGSTTSTPAIPEHFVKIYSTRPSPLCDNMTEYRLGFRPEPYITRVRQAMLGTRVDPSTLSAEERLEMGLVDSEKMTDTAIKDELRTWVPDYLIRHAWPDLISQYEAELKAKEIAKTTPKKKKAPAKTSRTKAVADPVAFRNFFTSTTVVSTRSDSEHIVTVSHSQYISSSPSQGRHSSPTPLATTGAKSSDIISMPAQRTASASTSTPSRRTSRKDVEKRSREAVSSGPSSARSSSSEPTGRIRASPSKKRPPITLTKRPPPARTHSTKSTGSSVEPIDLTISSDDDTPKKQPSAQKSPTTHREHGRRPAPTTPTPSSPTKDYLADLFSPLSQVSSSATPKATASQGLLTGMIVARSRPKPAPKAAPRKPKYVVYDDDDGVEHIDLL